jgi:tyrosinase
MKQPRLSVSLLCATVSLLLSSCATIPTCPNQLLPIVEIQVNNTASNHDDYGTISAYIPAQARLTNWQKFGGGLNFPGGVVVDVWNPAGSSNLTFSTVGGAAAGTATIPRTLPDNGGWSPFFVKGIATSTLDKSASIEIATTGACKEVVLARKAMMIYTVAPPIPPAPARPRVEIEIGSVATLDDYIAWNPTSSRIRWADGVFPNILNVTLQNMSGTDHLRFANNALPAGNTAKNATLSLTLNGDGSWVSFFMAGNPASPSTADKDAVLEVIDASNLDLLSREGLMVRIRKNANGLTTPERNRYLAALKKVGMTYLDYIEFVRTHSRASTPLAFSLVSHRQAHSGSAFMPWHRAFVLHIERLIQAADPSVALPYWKFDVPAPNIFTVDFMGSRTANPYCLLAMTNPIVSWSLPGEGVAAGIQRRTPYGDSGNPGVATEAATLALGANFVNFKAMEGTFHNPAHSTSAIVGSGANGSWVGGSPAIAPRDPLFFFLHCNVDRVWARWQWLNHRYIADVLTYDLQGSHAAPAAGVAAPLFTTNINGQITTNRTLGQYADDTMWPWNNVLNGAGTAQRPNVSLLQPLPIALGAVLPFATPTVKGVIDYISINPGVSGGLGYGYDDFFPFP